MSKCPRCTILVNFPDDHNGRWYKCPECYSYIRELSLKTSGLPRVDLGRSTPTGIVTVPANAVIVKPAVRLSAIPKNVIFVPQPAQQNQARTNSSTFTQNASQGSSSNSSQTASSERKTLSSEQIKKERKEITEKTISIDKEYKDLLQDLMKEYTEDPTWVPIIAGKLQEIEQNRLELFERLQALNNLETANLSNTIQDLRSKLESASKAPTKYISREPGNFGYSAFLGIGVMIWFTLSMGIQQWEFKTLMMMVGTGVGIAFVGWITGRGKD